MSKRLVGLLAVCCVCLSAAAEQQTEDSAAWRQRDVWQLQFEGLHTFTADDLRKALALDATVQRAVDVRLPVESFRRAVTARLTDGFHYAGFCDAVVSFHPDSSESKTAGRIKIAEGSRYRCGPIVVRGATDGIDVTPLQRHLQSKRTNSAQKSEGETDKEPVWKPGQVARVGIQRTEAFKEKTVDILREMGFPFAEVKASVSTDPDSQQCRLLVDIIDPGPRQQVSEVVIEGLQRHTKREVREFLNLSSPLYLSKNLLSELRHRLVSSGRFILVRVSTDEPVGPGADVPLRIHLREYADVCRLTETPTGTDAVMLQLAKWLQSLPESDDDIELHAEFTTTAGRNTAKKSGGATPAADASNALTIRVDGVIAGSGGAFFRTEIQKATDGPTADMSLLLTETNMGIVDSLHRRSWIDSAFPHGLISTVSVDGNPALGTTTLNDKTDQKFTLNYRLGFSSSASAPLISSMMINPAALIDAARKTRLSETTSAGDVVRLESHQTGHVALEVHKETGRLVSLRLQMPNGFMLTARSGKGLLEQAERQTLAAARQCPNLYNGQHAFASLVQFAAQTAGDFSADATFDVPPAASLLVRVLGEPPCSTEIGRCLDQLLKEDRFTIPHTRSAASATPSLKQQAMMHAAIGCVPIGSPAYELLSAVAHARTTGDTAALATFVRRTKSDKRIGPVLCMVLGELVTSLRPEVAAVGLQRLDEERLPASVQCVLENDCLCRHGLRQLVVHVRRCTDEEVDLLAGLTQQRPVVRAALTAVRVHPSDDADVVLNDLLTVLWKQAGCNLVRNRLTQWLRTDNSHIRPASRPQIKPPKNAEKQTPQKSSSKADAGVSRAAAEFLRRMKKYDALLPRN